VACLCAGVHQLEVLRAITPPWVVILPAPVAAMRALFDPAYYGARHAETHTRRARIATSLREPSWKVLPGVANFLPCQLPPPGPTVATQVARGREHGLFLRDAAPMRARLGPPALRIAVNAATNRQMLQIIREACR